MQDANWLELLHAAHGRTDGRDERRGDAIELAHTTPRTIIVTRATPAGLLETRIIRLAVVDVGHENWAGGCLPLLGRTDDLRLAVSVAHDELREQAESRSIVVALALEAEMPAVPSVTEHRAECVRTWADESSHVVRVVLQTLVVAGPARSEQSVAHALAIQLGGIESEARNVQSRRCDVARQLELTPQHRARIRTRAILAQVRGDPPRRPVGAIE